MITEETKPVLEPLDEKTYKIVYAGLLASFENAVGAQKATKSYSDQDAQYTRAAAECAKALIALADRKPPSVK